MDDDLLNAHVKEVSIFLEQSLHEISGYLNNCKLEDLMHEEGSGEFEYYKELLKALRRLEVFCDEANDTVNGLLREEPIRETAAERTLCGIHHQFILGFFSPKNDVWYEDSRASYSGKTSIKFHHQPPYSFLRLMEQLEKAFQYMREELSYYETADQKRMS
ncbi:DUF3907 family protein [Virgibacillus senegalensis]|uniref:DUF3907 family protein n=1 Tax=Virgibacillus senegalensis TaxID=1499679 RepID=UPI00069DE923|nr:DUF3907 family protein [Virgibacillus senegalensis]